MTWIAVLARVRRLVLLGGLVFAVLPVGSALADTTVGQAGGTAVCTPLDGATFADTNYVVPAGGKTITSFSVLDMSTFGSATNQVGFLALRLVSGSTYTVVGKTGLVTLAGTGLETFPADISVKAGDILGFWSNAFGLSNCVRSAVASGGGYIAGSGPVADPNMGDIVVFSEIEGSIDLNESANLVTLPTSKDQCKNGGWQTFGTTFKNQGDCVSSVATGGKSPPSGL